MSRAGHSWEKNAEKKLIFDFGVHLGKDSLFYLQKGFRVIGIEANPKLTTTSADSRLHRAEQALL